MLAIGSYTFPWAVGVDGFVPERKMTAFDLIDLAVAFKVPVVQLGDNIPMHLFSEGELRNLKQRADQASVMLELGTRGLTKDTIIHYTAIASTLNSSFLRIVIDEAGYEPGVSEVIFTINELLPVLRDRNIMLAIENHDRFSVEDLVKIISETDADQVGVCLDTANSIGAGESLRETVTGLAPYCINLHVKDIMIRRVSHKMGFIVEGTVAGKGILDLPWVIKQVLKSGRCKTVLVETWLNPERNVIETITKERKVAEDSIQYIKSIIND